METVNIIELKGLEIIPAAFTKGMVRPDVRGNYINKFKHRLAEDLFGSFIEMKKHNTVITLSGEKTETLIIETDIFSNEAEVFSSISKANNHTKICTLFSTFYALDIDVLAISLRNIESDPIIFLLHSREAIKNILNRGMDKEFQLNIIK